jgi:hypothetical protein
MPPARASPLAAPRQASPWSAKARIPGLIQDYLGLRDMTLHLIARQSLPKNELDMRLVVVVDQLRKSKNPPRD